MCPVWTLDIWGDQRGSNPRHSESQSDALPTELWPPHVVLEIVRFLFLRVKSRACQLKF